MFHCRLESRRGKEMNNNIHSQIERLCMMHLCTYQVVKYKCSDSEVGIGR